MGFAAFAQPEAFAVHFEDMDVMGQAVQNGAGEAFRAEDLGPFIEWQVGGDDDRAALVALGDDLEQQLGAGLAERNEAEFVDDQQVLAGQQLLQTLKAPFVGSLDQFVDQGGSRREANLQTLLAGRQSEPQGDVGLAGAARAQGDDVLAPIDEGAAGQFHGQGLVQRGDDLEVEAVQALGRRELGVLDPAFDHPAFALDQFQFTEPQQVVNMILVLRRALPGLLVVLAVEGRQAQLLEMMLQQDLRGIGHAAAPDISTL